MSGYSNRYYVCPYYSKDDRLRISCEGGSIKFPRRAEIEQYTDMYCCALPGWEHCSVAAMLNRYYDGTVNAPGVFVNNGGREIRSNLPQ